MTEWYVIDKRTQEIVNCVVNSGGGRPDLTKFTGHEHLYLSTNPTQAQLNAYEYYRDRP